MRRTKMERDLIQRYLGSERHDKDFLIFLIETIYGDTVSVCENCDQGLILEVVEGDNSWGQCDNCHKKYSYR